MRRKAFVLIELVAVMVILGVLSASSVIIISNLISGIQLSAAADRLAADIRYAQGLANAEGRRHGVVFSISPQNCYAVYTTTGTVENPGKPGNPFVVDLGADFSTSIASVEINGGSKVEFNPLGAPYDANGSALLQEAAISLNKGGSAKSVRITPRTGRVYIP